MARTWVLDTETKGTGAEMVPLDKAQKKAEPHWQRLTRQEERMLWRLRPT